MKRRWAIGAIAVAALLLLLGWGLWAVSSARCWTITGAVTCRVDTAQPIVAVSFDDGPTDTGVQAVLPILASRHVHATFFLIGGEAVQRPQLVRAIVAGGHEVGNHGWAHRRMFDLTPGASEAEITRTDAVLRANGATPTLFRPPYGKKLTGLPIAVARRGYRMVTWDVEEPTTRDPRAYAAEIVAAARPGSIILIHPMYRSGAPARAALPLILDGLARKGLRVVTVGALLATSPR